MFLQGREYYFVSVLIIFVAVILFMWSFERRKPQTREVVFLAVMVALAVAGRIMFFMTPQVKPCVAIIIVTGIALGKEAGFLSGVMTAFVSDFFFGQGTWTPYQMAAFGAAGFLSALLFSGGFRRLADNKCLLSVYGFVMTFVICGLILDAAAMFMLKDKPTLVAFGAACVSGLSYNLIHGLSIAVFLWFLSEALFKKLNRIKKRYGIYR